MNSEKDETAAYEAAMHPTSVWTHNDKRCKCGTNQFHFCADGWRCVKCDALYRDLTTQDWQCPNCGAYSDVVELVKHRKTERKLRIALDALEQFSQCNLNEDNCANLDIATQRIRNVATVALAKIKRIEPIVRHTSMDSADTALQAIRDSVGRLP